MTDQTVILPHQGKRTYTEIVCERNQSGEFNKMFNTQCSMFNAQVEQLFVLGTLW
jgi:hypothetical protein